MDCSYTLWQNTLEAEDFEIILVGFFVHSFAERLSSRMFRCFELHFPHTFLQHSPFSMLFRCFWMYCSYTLSHSAAFC